MKKMMAFGLAVACLAAQAQEIRWPSANSAWIKGGRYVNSEDLSKMQVGLNRDQVRDLIGFPTYNEGIKVMDWTYLMNFAVNGGTVQCQYKVLFDKQYKVNAMMWKPVGENNNCPPVESKPEPPPLVVMSADGLFKFDSTELLPQGVAEIRPKRIAAKRIGSPHMPIVWATHNTTNDCRRREPTWWFGRCHRWAYNRKAMVRAASAQRIALVVKPLRH